MPALLSPAAVREALAALGESQRGYARARGIDARTVRRWCEAGASPVASALLRADLALAVPPPPATLAVAQDRDEPCGEALDPRLDALAERAEAAGWHPAEVVAAVLGWAVHRALDGAGVAATLALLAESSETARFSSTPPAVASAPSSSARSRRAPGRTRAAPPAG